MAHKFTIYPEMGYTYDLHIMDDNSRLTLLDAYIFIFTHTKILL